MNTRKTSHDPHYVRKIKCLARLGQIPTAPGSKSQVTVYHEQWCRLFYGGRCDCNPEVRVRWTQPPGLEH